MPTWTLWKVSIRLALILMTGSLFVCKEVSSPRELQSVPLGLPVPFIVLDARRYTPPEYPQCFRFGSRHADPMRLKPLAALADVVLLTLMLVVAARVLDVGWSSGRASRSGGPSERRPGGRPRERPEGQPAGRPGREHGKRSGERSEEPHEGR